VRAQDSWDTVPKPGDPDPFRPGEKAGPMPRTGDGKPDLSGIWQERTLAAWDVVKHRGDYGYPGGPGIVEGDKIPYQDWALKKRGELAKSLYNDPQVHCQLPGVPRITYMPYPFEIVQSAGSIHLEYEYMHAWRIFHLDRTAHSEEAESFDGDSIAHWEGDTLVVDVTSFNDKTWLIGTGTFHTDALHITERFTRVDKDQINYEAVMEDPNVFTKPWVFRSTMMLREGTRVREYVCGENNEDPARYEKLLKDGVKFERQ
jgi:hypothetical protein